MKKQIVSFWSKRDAFDSVRSRYSLCSLHSGMIKRTDPPIVLYCIVKPGAMPGFNFIDAEVERHSKALPWAGRVCS